MERATPRGRVRATAAELDGAEVVRREVRARREINEPETQGNLAQPDFNAKPANLARGVCALRSRLFAGGAPLPA